MRGREDSGPGRLERGAGATLVATGALLGTWGAALARSDVTLGVRGGISVASASLDASETFADENRTGLAGGAFLAMQPGPLGPQLEALDHEKGFREENGPRDLDVAYLELPALLELGLPLAAVRPGVLAGVAVAFETRCEFQGLGCAEDRPRHEERRAERRPRSRSGDRRRRALAVGGRPLLDRILRHPRGGGPVRGDRESFVGPDRRDRSLPVTGGPDGPSTKRRRIRTL